MPTDRYVVRGLVEIRGVKQPLVLIDPALIVLMR
jgi:hypothetical protein